MVYVPVQCPHCQSTEVIKAGKQANGVQRYLVSKRAVRTADLSPAVPGPGPSTRDSSPSDRHGHQR